LSSHSTYFFTWLSMPGNFVIGTDMELGSRIRFLLAGNP
jgi:hypothetical protein